MEIRADDCWDWTVWQRRGPGCLRHLSRLTALPVAPPERATPSRADGDLEWGTPRFERRARAPLAKTPVGGTETQLGERVAMKGGASTAALRPMLQSRSSVPKHRAARLAVRDGGRPRISKAPRLLPPLAIVGPPRGESSIASPKGIWAARESPYSSSMPLSPAQ